MLTLDTIAIKIEDRVLHATLDTPPLNMISPELVRDLITLINYLDSHQDDISVVVFDSASRDFFSAHVDMVRVSGLGTELARLGPGSTLGSLFRRISTLRQVLDRVYAVEDAMAGLRRERLQVARDLLTPEQQAKFLLFSARFQKEMRERMLREERR